MIAGRYKVRQEIGEGGMGSVYLAEQTHPVRRQVALKLIKPGMDSRTVLARFESERQALALMDHPNIAKVLDAGATDQGRPFFVMELVKGIPLTDYCDQHRLDLPARLSLFRQICSAVQHAHQKGIIHRDLKPTNILVESHDGRPVPKVIDFGLAKATSGMQLSEHSLFTAFGSVTGTPLYMAPEQASFNALDVYTRADIYALGVILYELLAGSTPIQGDTMRRAALDEMLRVIREDEPPTPSSRISSSGSLPSLAASRHVEPARLSRLVRGDLDWIVMKALAKERNRRYDSAIGLANDIERYTNHEPVTAGPPTARYRLGKFVRRNRGRVVAAALVLLALVGGVVGTTLGLVEARRQERRARHQEAIALAETAEKEKARAAEAEQKGRAIAQERLTRKRLEQRDKSNAILLSVFADLDPRTGDKDTLALSARLGRNLDAASAALEGEANDDPLGVARMQMALSRAQLSLGYAEKAIALLTRARATFTSRLGPDHPDTLASMNELALGYSDAGKLDRALPLLEETLALSRSKLGPDHPDTLASMANLAEVYRKASKLDRALPLLEETLALMKSKLGPDHPHTLASMNDLAAGYWSAGRLDRSIPLFEEAVKLRVGKSGDDHPETWKARANLGVNYRDAGRLDEALPLLEGAHRASRRHPPLRWVASALLDAYARAGQADKAATLAAETLAEGRAGLPAGSPQLAGLLAQTGSTLVDLKAWDRAEPILRECLAIREKAEPEDWGTFDTRSMLGAALLGRKNYAEAGPLLRSGYEGIKARAEKIPPRARASLGKALDRLIALAEATDKPDEAKAWKEERAKLPAEAPKPEAGKG